MSFEKDDEDINGRFSFSEYFMPDVEIKDFNILIDSKSFLDVPMKNHNEIYKKNIEMSKNNDHNLLDYEYFLNHYKLIAIDSRKQIEIENPD